MEQTTDHIVMEALRPFSCPFIIDSARKRNACYVEVSGRPYEAHWTGDWAVFDFSDTTKLKEFQLIPMALSTKVLELWARTETLAFGAYACVRLDAAALYPVVKIAHPNDQCRRLVHREFEIMQRLHHTGAVAEVAADPLVDEHGTYGFRLERLYRIDLDELEKRHDEVKELLNTIHAAGYCHGDFSPSNVLKTKTGRLLMIDLAFGGLVKDKTPDFFPGYLFQDGVFTEAVDYQRLEKWPTRVS
ncbi:hypothetical protein KC353_g1642 [Hortaea werneckii]|nr:hypothetical protein KC357_g9164 [Hortaea werneckii]KAI7721098.1 hypothetical protein KC353_g1642 [Hortaea werneckii]